MGISDISSGKHTRNFRSGSSRNCLDITDLVRIYPWLEDIRIRFMANRPEETPVPVTNLYKTPQTLGMDRLAAVVAANWLKPGHDVLVIDAGTCVTYDFIDADGAYHDLIR